MSSSETFQLTTKDHAILEVMRERNVARDEIISEILRRKLSRAIIRFSEDIPADIVTLSSRVTYRIDDGPAETRILAPDNMRGLIGLLLPIGHPRALALIGLAEGQSMAIPRTDGGLETLTAVNVMYQPEAARRERLMQPLTGGPSATSRSRPALKLVHSSEGPTNFRAADDRVEPDDPGPSAA